MMQNLNQILNEIHKLSDLINRNKKKSVSTDFCGKGD